MWRGIASAPPRHRFASLSRSPAGAGRSRVARSRPADRSRRPADLRRSLGSPSPGGDTLARRDRSTGGIAILKAIAFGVGARYASEQVWRPMSQLGLGRVEISSGAVLGGLSPQDAFEAALLEVCSGLASQETPAMRC